MKSAPRPSAGAAKNATPASNPSRGNQRKEIGAISDDSPLRAGVVTPTDAIHKATRP